MKFTLSAIIAILAITSSINAEAKPNCAATSTKASWCLKCVGTDCADLSCANGWRDTNICKDPTTKISGCVLYSNGTTCSQCTSGQVLDAGACVEPTTKVDGCATYRGNKATSFCTSCASGKQVGGNANTAFVDGGITIGTCVDSTPTTPAPTATPDANCEWKTVSSAQNVNTNGYTPACEKCKAGWVKHATTTACTEQLSTRKGCGVWDGTDCIMCHWTHQMTEPNVCTDAPTASAYSAILSVASMIVALLFANF